MEKTGDSESARDMDILVADFVQFDKILHGGLTKHEEDILHIESLRAMGAS